MKSKEFYLVMICFVIVLIAVVLYFDSRLDDIEMAMEEQKGENPDKAVMQHITSINIEKFEGIGNVFGDNNNIQNLL